MQNYILFVRKFDGDYEIIFWWVIMPCILTENCRHFRGNWFLRHDDKECNSDLHIK